MEQLPLLVLICKLWITRGGGWRCPHCPLATPLFFVLRQLIISSLFPIMSFQTIYRYILKMNKKCAKCEKTVYPVEELKCLEKIWHKTCFKCQAGSNIFSRYRVAHKRRPIVRILKYYRHFTLFYIHYLHYWVDQKYFWIFRKLASFLGNPIYFIHIFSSFIKLYRCRDLYLFSLLSSIALSSLSLRMYSIVNCNFF